MADGNTTIAESPLGPASHRVILGDARRMEELEDASVQLVVTSPPYWQIKDYACKGQIGYGDTYEGYVNNLNLVWSECVRVLSPGCRMCVNVGDQFARGCHYGRYAVIPIRTEIIKFCQAARLEYMGAIIWRKVTTCNPTGGATVMGSFPYPRNGVVKIDYEFILLFRKPGRSAPPSPEAKDASKLTPEEWNTCFQGHWNMSGERQLAHIAPFPEELPARLIRMFSFVGETVLDPFLGSATTSLAAGKLGRSSVGYEINRAYRDVMEMRLRACGGLFSRVRFLRQKPRETDFAARIAKLPYVFRDPAPLDRTHRRRLPAFGSRVTGRERPRETYTRVRTVLSPECVELRTGARVRLAGVREKPRLRPRAIAWLDRFLAGKKVFFKPDPLVDGDGMGYLYLANRTLVNARLIKSGLVAAEDRRRYARKSLFLKYAARSEAPDG
ncbi:MAG: site-specific DNA-methyltransferase [Planctomycetota bacterium]